MSATKTLASEMAEETFAKVANSMPVVAKNPLIEAAPELLKFAMDMVERYPNSPWILEQANQAINKALGKAV